jgi:hypothetical protein
MSANQIKIRHKEISKPKMKKINIFIGFAVIIFLCSSLAFAVAALTDKLDFFSAPLEIVSEQGRTIIRVPVGGDLQGAVNRARSGDIIELKAGATYYGEIKLPNKPIDDFITIQTSAVKQLPENQRIKPAQSHLLAKIVSRGRGAAAVLTENAAHHYRFVGIEFAPGNTDYVYNLVFFGQPENLADVAHHLEIDRCYFHPFKTGTTRRGIALNSQTTTIKNSYFEGFAFFQEETQAILGWTGTKDVKIINNYIEGGAENIMFGGGDPVSADLIPADIEVRGNHLNKPVEWKGKVSMKCLFELKNAMRVQFVGNYLENNWEGEAFRITVRNQDGTAPFSTIEDVLIKDNIIDGSGMGINILGTDNIHPSQTLKGLNIVNNLFLNIGGENWAGNGYFIQINDGENILIANNTVFNIGNITSLYGELPRNFHFRDNIVGHGNYGIHGHENIKSPAGQRLFQNNVIVNNQKVNPLYTSYPPGNFWVQSYKYLGFANFEQNDFRLAPDSRFKGKGRDNNDIGSNLSLDTSAKSIKSGSKF